jgi:hypothetical protein
LDLGSCPREQSSDFGCFICGQAGLNLGTWYLELESWVLGPARVNNLLILDASVAVRQAWILGTARVNNLLIFDALFAVRQAWVLILGTCPREQSSDFGCFICGQAGLGLGTWVLPA